MFNIINFTRLKNHLKEPLYKNSFYIMVTSLLTAFVGFIFWIIAAKLYPSEDVGIATALISAMNLIFFISIMGFDQSIIRFFPEIDKSKVFSTALTVTVISTTVFSIIFILGMNIWSPELNILKNYFALFIIFVLANALTYLMGISFIATREGRYYFLQGLLVDSRIIFLPFLIFFGSLGIFSSVGLSYIVSLIFSIYILFKLGIRYVGVDKKFFRESLHFSAGNYINSLLMTVPGQLLTILVLNILGPSNAAYYYIAFTIASILFLVPYSLSTSLFIEGSHGEPLRENTIKALVLSFLILIPSVIILIFFGEQFLGFIGSAYQNSYNLLLIFSFSSFLVVIFQIFINIKKIEKDIRTLIWISAVNSFFLITLSYIFLLKFGLIGIGYAWILAYGVVSFIILFIIKKENWI